MGETGDHEALAAIPAPSREQRSHRQHVRKALRRTEDDVARARIGVSARVGLIRPNDDIVDAVAVHISCAAHRLAQVLESVLRASDRETLAAISAARREQARELRDRRKALRRTEHHETRTRRVARIGRACTRRADDDIVDTIAIEVSGRAYSDAGAVVLVGAGEHEALAAIASVAWKQTRE